MGLMYGCIMERGSRSTWYNWTFYRRSGIFCRFPLLFNTPSSPTLRTNQVRRAKWARVALAAPRHPGRRQVTGSAQAREILSITRHWPREPGGRCCTTVLASTGHVWVLKGVPAAEALLGLETTRVCVEHEPRGRFCWQAGGQPRVQPKDATISR